MFAAQRLCRLAFVTLITVLVATVAARSEAPPASRTASKTLAVPPPIVALALIPSGNRSVDETFVAASQAGMSPSRLQSEIMNPHDASFTPNGRSLVVCGGHPGQGGLAEIFDWTPGGQTLAPRRVLTIGSDSLYAAAWSPEGDLLAVAGLDGFGRVIDAATGQERLRLSGHSRGLTGIQFLHSQRLVTSSLDGSLRVWDVESGEPVRTLANHTGPVTGLCLGPRREPARLRMAASVGDDRTVRIWQPDIGRLVRFARLPSTPLATVWLSRSAAAAAQDGVLAVACLDGHVRLISVGTVEILADERVLDGPIFCIVAESTEETLLLGGHAGRTHQFRVDELWPAASSAK